MSPHHLLLNPPYPVRVLYHVDCIIVSYVGPHELICGRIPEPLPDGLCMGISTTRTLFCANLRSTFFFRTIRVYSIGGTGEDVLTNGCVAQTSAILLANDQLCGVASSSCFTLSAEPTA